MRCELRRCVERARLDWEGVGVGVVGWKEGRLLVLVENFRLVGEVRSGTVLVSTFSGFVSYFRFQLRWSEVHCEAVDEYPLECLVLWTAR